MRRIRRAALRHAQSKQHTGQIVATRYSISPAANYLDLASFSIACACAVYALCGTYRIRHRGLIILHRLPLFKTLLTATMSGMFTNTSAMHGSPVNGITTQLTHNISWTYNPNPWNAPGRRSDNETHLGCLSNNVTLQEICCKTVGGQIIEADRAVVPSGNASSSDNGASLWCALPENGTYNDHYNSQPVLVDSWAKCYNSTVAPYNQPGVYLANLKPISDVWQCELRGNFSGSSVWKYPSYASAPTSGSGSQVGRFSLLALAGVVSVATLAASSLGTYQQRESGLPTLIVSNRQQRSDWETVLWNRCAHVNRRSRGFRYHVVQGVSFVSIKLLQYDTTCSSNPTTL